jgi:DNA-binding transcriptional regulator YbjK
VANTRTHTHEPIESLRVQPKQRRAIAQLHAIEDAARYVLGTKGRDRFTTKDIASRAQVSIGTVYRYFPDRVAILDHVWPDRKDVTLPSTKKK